jgi:hypothetical protein
MDQDLITQQTNPSPQSITLNDEEWDELLTLVKEEWDATTEEKYTEIWSNIYLQLRTQYNDDKAND